MASLDFLVALVENFPSLEEQILLVSIQKASVEWLVNDLYVSLALTIANQ